MSQPDAKKLTSYKADSFTESVIREMTRLANQHDAINLAQGFADFPAPAEIKQAAIDAINADINQYAITWGAKSFRDALVEKTRWYLGLDVDPEKEITVTCGSTEAMIAALMAIINPGDEVIVFEPFYENYGPDAILSGAAPRFVTLHPPEWNFDSDELKAAFNDRTKAIIINTPNNPTGKVFSRQELEFIADLCLQWNVIAVTDEIYEHILYDDAEHVAIATLDGMRQRTVTINGMSKTYSVTGWRVGYTMAPWEITSAIRKVHDFLTVGAPAPLQEAGALALKMPPSYYQELAAEYAERREVLWQALVEVGFKPYRPRGAYYIITDIHEFGFPSDGEFAHYLIKDIGVAVVPGSSFYQEPLKGSQQVRFSFCKKIETLKQAADRLRRLRR